MRLFPRTALFIGAALFVMASVVKTARANGDDFKSVVKFVEQFYSVKHQSLPFLARTGIKTATTAARIAGGTKKRIAEAGSVKVAFFEDEDFGDESRADRSPHHFKTGLNATLLATWTPLVQTLSPKENEQTYIFLRNAGDKFDVLVLNVEKHDAIVVQVTISPKTLAELMRDPSEMGKVIADDATNNDQE
jgi:hypothetical protein